MKNFMEKGLEKLDYEELLNINGGYSGSSGGSSGSVVCTTTSTTHHESSVTASYSKYYNDASSSVYTGHCVNGVNAAIPVSSVTSTYEKSSSLIGCVLYKEAGKMFD